MAPEKLLLQLQVQPWLLHWGSGREKDTSRASHNWCFSLLCFPSPRHKDAVGPQFVTTPETLDKGNLVM